MKDHPCARSVASTKGRKIIEFDCAKAKLSSNEYDGWVLNRALNAALAGTWQGDRASQPHHSPRIVALSAS